MSALASVAHLADGWRAGQSTCRTHISANGLYRRPESRCCRGNGDGVREGEPSVGRTITTSRSRRISAGDIGAVASVLSSCWIQLRNGARSQSCRRTICHTNVRQPNRSQVADMGLDGNLNDATRGGAGETRSGSDAALCYANRRAWAYGAGSRCGASSIDLRSSREALRCCLIFRR